MRKAAFLLPFLLAVPLLGDVVAGRTHILVHDRWAPQAGGTLTALGRPVQSAAFDGRRFLTGWRDGEVVWLALYDEGATIPFTMTSIDVPGTRPPIVRWGGSQFVVFCEGEPSHIALVSPQGVVETLGELPGANAIVDLAASPFGIALLAQYGTATHTSVLEVILLDNRLGESSRTMIGSIVKSTGSGGTYLQTPHIAPFGAMFYAAWREGRSARYENVVGTRVLLDGTAPDVVPSQRETSSLSATYLDFAMYPAPTDVALHQYGSRLVVQPIRQWGYGITTVFVESDGSANLSDVGFSTGQIPPPTPIGTVQFPNQEIAAYYVMNGALALKPMLGPLVRRRSSRH